MIFCIQEANSVKKIVCELCESTEFAKDGGMFICQGCGTKYTLEEAKGMMKEVEGDSPVSSAGVPTINPNQKQLENILVLATNAYEADNKKEAENYCNRAIEIDAMCHEAWFLKGKAVGWQSTVDNLRIEEAAHSFCKAIDCAPEEEKEDFKEQAVQELKSLGVALISLRKNRFSSSPDDAELRGFTSDRKVLIDSLLILLHHGNAVGIPDGYLDEIATLMNEAAVAALNMARKAWEGVDHPSDKDLSTFIDWCSNIESLIRQSIDASDEDDEADIVRYRNLAIVLEEPIGMHSQKRYWDSFWSEYRWQNSQELTNEAVNIRRKGAKEARAKADAIEARIKAEKAIKAAAEKKAAEEAKQKRIEAYWNEHKEEKDKLESEMMQLSAKKEELEAQIADIIKQINEAEKEEKIQVPSEIEEAKLRDQVRELNNRRSKLGIFSGKEKKQITEEINVLENKIAELKTAIDAEKKRKAEELSQKLSPLRSKREELNKVLTETRGRLFDIEKELNKDPEE